MQFRNVAIIAHVDHGKTTLVDGLLHQCHAFQAHEQIDDRVMDSGDLERERGITITAKNTAVFYRDIKINICDTPGHADFGGEVERVLQMCDGALLLVDASEGPLPQTRFVTRKAMDAGLKIIVCINKIDRPDARIDEVLEEIYDLFIELDADDEQLEFPVLYACARDGIAYKNLEDYDPKNQEEASLRPLLDAMVDSVPPPTQTEEGQPARVLITNLDYDPYVGRLALGRLVEGSLKKGSFVTWFSEETQKKVRVQLLYTWSGLRRHEVSVAEAGDIIAIAGIEHITVGDTIADGDNPVALPRITIDEPTIGMEFSINSSPFCGRDGKMLTSSQIRERLQKELMSNVSLRIESVPDSDAIKVFGRGELQLAILIEQMRREGFELSISRPEVVRKEVDGRNVEPFERVTIDVPDQYVGDVTQHMAARKGSMVDMSQDGSGRSMLEYRIPTRGLIGFRGVFLTDTRGEGIMNTIFDGWDNDVGFITQRIRGALINDRTGKTTTNALYKLQPRGKLFVGNAEEAYEGMIIGIHTKENDLNVDATRAKQLTNFRTVNADEKQVLATPIQLTLERALEFIDDSELVEVTPKVIRLRKRELNSRKRTIVRGAGKKR